MSDESPEPHPAQGRRLAEGRRRRHVRPFNEAGFDRMIELTPPDTMAVLHDDGPGLLVDDIGDDEDDHTSRTLTFPVAQPMSRGRRGGDLHGGGRTGGPMRARQQPVPVEASGQVVRRRRGRMAAMGVVGGLALLATGLAVTLLKAADGAESRERGPSRRALGCPV